MITGRPVQEVNVNIITSGKRDVSVVWKDNHIARIMLQQIKHLQHLPLFFSKGDITSLVKNKNGILNDFMVLGEKLGVNINPEALHLQSYLNHLHQQYEERAPKEGYKNGWSDYHDCIHFLESDHSLRTANVLKFFTYEDFGHLMKPYYEEYNKYLTLDIKQGDVTISWTDLGKKPYQYWKDNEPENQERINELAKPWSTLRPPLKVYLEDYQFKIPKKTEFLNWFAPYKEEWCKHWNLTNWKFEDQWGDIIIGNIPDIYVLIDNINSGNIPNKVRL